MQRELPSFAKWLFISAVYSGLCGLTHYLTGDPGYAANTYVDTLMGMVLAYVWIRMEVWN